MEKARGKMRWQREDGHRRKSLVATDIGVRLPAKTK